MSINNNKNMSTHNNNKYINLHLKSSSLNQILKLEIIHDHIYRANYLSSDRSTGIYGGQIICQAMLAAQQTLTRHTLLHSIHAYFILAGDKGKPVIYHVEKVRDGKTFTTRLVKALQSGRHIFSCILSFQKEEPTIYSFQRKMPHVEWPENLPNYEDVLQRSLKNNRVTDFQRLFISSFVQRELTYIIKPANKNWMRLFLEDNPERFGKYVKYDDDDGGEGDFNTCTNNPNNNNRQNNNNIKDGDDEEDDDDHIKYWIKFKDEIDPKRQDIHRMLAGYLSDLFLLQSIVVKIPTKKFFPAMMCSLDHCIWYHTQFRVDEWLLYECWCSRYSSSRAITHGRIWRRDGVLAVTMMQEGLLRITSML